MPKKFNLVPLECEEDALFFEWSEIQALVVPELKTLYHIPNECGWKLGRSQGVRAGVSDWHLPVPSRSYIGLFIEMKRQKGSNTSQAQKDWLLCMQNFGHYATVCKGFGEARKVTMWYLGMPEVCKP